MWTTVSEHPSLNPDEVHVWQTSLVLPSASVISLRDLLSVDERARADRFVFARDRDQFTIARARLRQLLAAYLNLAPHELRFDYNPFGKPQLSVPVLNTLQFNVSHSGELALIAIAQNRRVGVDIEAHKPQPAFLEIARSVFSAEEYAALEAVPAPQQGEVFYRIWTHKEAFIKALGEGLSHLLDSFSMTLREDAPPMLKLLGGDAEAPWTLHTLEVNENYSGALAIEGVVEHVRQYLLT